MARISERFRYESTLNRVNSARSLGDEAQQTAVSGSKLRKLSDDPVNSVRLFRNRAETKNVDQFRKSVDFAQGFLAKTEDSLRSINDSLIRAKELAIQQSNSTYDAVSRQAVAQEIRQIAEHVSVLGNTTYHDRYVFGGFRTSQPPISPDGQYLGDDGIIYAQVDEDVIKPVNLPGRKIFDIPVEEEGKNKSLVGIIHGLYEGLSANDPHSIQKSIDEIDMGINRVIESTAALGGRRSSFDAIAERLEHSEERLAYDNNNIEAADLAKTAMDLRRAETGLQYTLQSSGKLLSPTLLNFLN